MPFSLIGTLGLDTSPYESALSKVERKALESRAKFIEGQRADAMNPMLANAGAFNKAGAHAGESFWSKFKEAFHAENIGEMLKGNFSSFLGLGAGALGVAGGYMVASHMASEYKGEVKDARIGASRTGLDVERYQQVAKTVASVNGSVGDIQSALDRLAKAQRDIREGAVENGPETPGAAKSLKALAVFGISEEDAKGKDFRDLLFQIADAFKYAEKPTAEMIAAMRDLRITADLVPAFQKGFGSARAKAGNISEEEVAEQKAMMKATEATDVFWANIWHHTQKGAYDGIQAMKMFFPIIWGELTNSLKGPEKRRADQAKKDAEEAEKYSQQQEKIAKAKAAAEARVQEMNDAESVKYADELTAKAMAEQDAESEKLDEKNQRTERELKLKKMSPEARKAALDEEKKNLTKEYDDIQKQIGGLDLGNPDSKEKFSELNLAAQKKREQLLGVEKEIPELPKVGVENRLDALASIGGFGGGADQGMRQEFAKQTGILTEIARNTRPGAPRDIF